MRHLLQSQKYSRKNWEYATGWPRRCYWTCERTWRWSCSWISGLRRKWSYCGCPIRQSSHKYKKKKTTSDNWFLCKEKNQLKLNVCSPTDFYWQLPLNRGKICIILVDSPYKQHFFEHSTVAYKESRVLGLEIFFIKNGHLFLRGSYKSRYK